MEVKDTFFSRNFNMNCEGKLIDLSTPKVMGILNTTPDSFYDGGESGNLKAALSKCETMISEGAAFIDVGGCSSQPGAKQVSIEDEITRTAPFIEALKKEFPSTYFSIDTFNSEVAAQALASGACIINDISGGKLDAGMYSLVQQKQVPYIVMHMRGNPQNMQQNCNYENVALEVTTELSEITTQLKSKGINDVLVDPGFGFSKTLQQNFDLLKNLETVNHLHLPMLVGISRKSMIYKTLNCSSKEALNGTTAINTIAILKGANILRVHDVKEAQQIIDLTQMM